MEGSDTTQEVRVIAYVPDVICPDPNCSEIMEIPRETYAWYSGEVGCRHCKSTVFVKIGD